MFLFTLATSKAFVASEKFSSEHLCDYLHITYSLMIIIPKTKLLFNTQVPVPINTKYGCFLTNLYTQNSSTLVNQNVTMITK